MLSEPPIPFTDDPDRLLARWQALLAEQPHTHLPQAAAALGVSEGALVATRVGNGAVRLQPRLAALFDGIEQWRKVFVVTPNRLGVTIAILNVLSCSERGGGLELLGEQHWIAIDTARVRHCYLFEDHDVHGRSLSLCWFDAEGNGLGKLFLRSRSGQEVAVPRLMARALPEQSRVFGAAERSGVTRGIFAPHTLKTNPQAERLTQAALAAASRLEAVELRMTGGAVDSLYSGPLTSFSQTPGALHLSAAGCKAHLRPAAAQAITPLQHDDGRHGLRIDTGNGALLITPTAGTDRHWLKSLMEENA